MTQRDAAIDRIDGGEFDVLVVGGGINGAVSAMCLSAHGVSVALVDRDDFASGTSQESSNMVWGGFKYLEGYEIPLVVGLCRSRNLLASAYPTRVTEARFLAALDRSSPHAPWFAALGAAAYWALGGFRTKAPRYRRPSTITKLEPSISRDELRGGIEYSDCLLLDNDSRFVSQMAIDAAEHGAAVANYVGVLGAVRRGGRWTLDLRDERTGRTFTTSAGTVVNAAGAHVADIGDLTQSHTQRRLVLSKGIHLVVPQITDSGRILAFYDDERRLFYVLPMGDRSVIGTTDTRVDDPSVEVTLEECEFLLGQVNKRLDLEVPLTLDDVIASRCGVRGLVVDGSEDESERDWTELSRRHAIETDVDRCVVSVLGGKLSDCLNVGKEVVEAVKRCGVSADDPPVRWFGEPADAERERFLLRARQAGLARRPVHDTAATMSEMLWRRHGHRAHGIVALIERDRSLGEPLTPLGDYTRAEIQVMATSEWIVTMDDFLRRRTQLAQLNRPEVLRSDPGIREAARTLVGAQAAEDWMLASDPISPWTTP